MAKITGGESEPITIFFMYRCTRILVCCLCVWQAQWAVRKWKAVIFCKEPIGNKVEEICNMTWTLIKVIGECCSPDLLAYC